MVDRLREGLPFANKTVAETVAEVASEFEAKGIQCLLVAGFDGDGDLYVRSARLSRADANWLIDAVKDDVLHGDTKIAIAPAEEATETDERKIIKFDGQLKGSGNAE